MVLTEDEVSRLYPLHWMVWNNQHEQLKTALETNRFTAEDLELKDPQGRTPLLLAVTINYIECVKALIDAGADVNCEKDGWTALQEATATGDAALVRLVWARREARRAARRAAGVPDLLRRLSLAPDFYVEMKWEFTSWVPLVSRMCPSDTYRVYKRGANVRVDTTLLGFSRDRWQRGARTYIFTGQGRSASLTELDHELGTAWVEYLQPPEEEGVGVGVGAEGAQEAGAEGEDAAPSAAAVQQRLAAPLAINYLDTDKISFERDKSGLWGWRQDKVESVAGYECKVFSAHNVELVSKTRTEHLSEKYASSGGVGAGAGGAAGSLAGLLALADQAPRPTKKDSSSESSSDGAEEDEEGGVGGVWKGPGGASWREYFAGGSGPAVCVGRPRREHARLQRFKAQLWLCEDYPLQLQEQVMPVLDLMAAISSPHFSKLKDFVQMQLPAGFPVKIEIPLFHVVNARITFGNIFATDTPVPHVDCIQEGSRLSCIVDDSCFLVGAGYGRAGGAATAAGGARGAGTTVGGAPHEDELLQYAIQQSLLHRDALDEEVDVWEALRGTRPAPAPSPRSPRSVRSPLSPRSPHSSPPSVDSSVSLAEHDLLHSEEAQLQRAIEESLCLLRASPRRECSAATGAGGGGALDDGQVEAADAALAAALLLSAREHEAAARLALSDQQALDDALRRSLTER